MAITIQEMRQRQPIDVSTLTAEERQEYCLLLRQLRDDAASAEDMAEFQRMLAAVQA